MRADETPVNLLPCPICCRIADLTGYEHADPAESRVVLHYVCHGGHQIDMTVQDAPPEPPRAA